MAITTILILVTAHLTIAGLFFVWNRYSGTFRPDNFDITVILLMWEFIVILMLGFLLVEGLVSIGGFAGRWIDGAVLRIFQRKIQKDEFGELYRGPGPGGTPVTRVKVKDRTGTHWIRVTDEVETAKGAVASSFRVDEAEYSPVEQS